mgnify:CR=1 FL=1
MPHRCHMELNASSILTKYSVPRSLAWTHIGVPVSDNNIDWPERLYSHHHNEHTLIIFRSDFSVRTPDWMPRISTRTGPYDTPEDLFLTQRLIALTSPNSFPTTFVNLVYKWVLERKMGIVISFLIILFVIKMIWSDWRQRKVGQLRSCDKAREKNCLFSQRIVQYNLNVRFLFYSIHEFRVR